MKRGNPLLSASENARYTMYRSSRRSGKGRGGACRAAANDVACVRRREPVEGTSALFLRPALLRAPCCAAACTPSRRTLFQAPTGASFSLVLTYTNGNSWQRALAPLREGRSGSLLQHACVVDYLQWRGPSDLVERRERAQPVYSTGSLPLRRTRGNE